MLAAAGIAIPAAAFADCNTLNENSAWNRGIIKLQKQVDTGKYN